MAFKFYPYRLLPFTGYTQSVSIDEILNNGVDFAVARRVEGDKDKILKEMYKGYYVIRDPDILMQNIFSQIPSLSLTILGTGAQFEDMGYLQKENAKADWDGKTHLPFRYLTKVSICKEYFSLVYRVSSIHKKPIEYGRKFNSKDSLIENLKYVDSTNDAETILKSFTKKSTYKMLPGQIQVEHRPTMLNYWHSELKLLPASLLDKERVKNVKFKKDKPVQNYNDKELMVLYIWRTYLSMGFEVNKNPLEDISDSHFRDGSINYGQFILNKWMSRIFYGIIPLYIK